MVEGLCRGLLRDRTEAEDAAQQTFLSAYRALLGGTEPREPAAWLATIGRNECLARIRARMREPLPVEELEAEETRADPLSEALRRADIAAFWSAVSELPRPQREALLMREFGGLSYDELALALGVSQPAVESLLFRARTRVRGQLREALASISTAGWASAAQEALARLLSAGGAAKIGSVPVVAKAVTAGVGIAVVASTAVVGEQRHSSPSRQPHHASLTAAAPKPSNSLLQGTQGAVVRVAAAVPVRQVRQVSLLTVARQRHADEHQTGSDHAQPERQPVETDHHQVETDHHQVEREHSTPEVEHAHRASTDSRPTAQSGVVLRAKSGEDQPSPENHSENSASPQAPRDSSTAPSDSSSPPPESGPVPAIATAVTAVLPHDGRVPPAGD